MEDKIKVLVNAEEQYSFWPEWKEIPKGWKDTGFLGTKEEAGEYVINFGKYAGKKMKELPETYLTWLYENSKDETIKTCADYLMEHLTNEEAQERMMLIEELSALMTEKEINREKLYKHYKVNSNGEMSIQQLQDAINKLTKE